MTVPAIIHSLDPGALVEMFELDLREISGVATDRYYFHAGVNALKKPLVWQGVSYQPFPVEATGFEVNAKGTLPRPVLKASNVTGVLTALVLAYDDLIGAKVIRRRTFARYLDEANFSGVSNLLPYSEELNRASYTKQNLQTPTPNYTLAPDGTTSAERFLETATTGNHRVSMTQTFYAGFYYTLSVYAKPEGRSHVSLELPSTAFGAYQRVRIDLAAKTVTTTAGTPVGRVVDEAPNGFIRVSLTAQAQVTTPGSWNIFVDNGSAISYAGDTTKGLGLWGAQLVMLDSAGTYQKTLAATSLNPTADPTQYLPEDVFYVERKVNENRQFVELELASAMDLQGFKLPNRVVTVGTCSWQYRRWDATKNDFVYPKEKTCPYAGSSYFDSADATTAQPQNDSCSRTVAGCKARFGAKGLLPFGGFPAARAYKL